MSPLRETEHEVEEVKELTGCVLGLNFPQLSSHTVRRELWYIIIAHSFSVSRNFQCTPALSGDGVNTSRRKTAIKSSPSLYEKAMFRILWLSMSAAEIMQEHQ
ncbi:hypothetical protein BaRGS_00022573 [Batillaria attramentaria]|uniref:Uncharacterized protein n=1 Tax=Batillaria attramentaria TaxID=370345 RepID=A0ABD0KH25_9CAEN